MDKNIFYVYKILNKLNGKFYVGRTNDMIVRKKSHVYKLVRNIHHCRYLQNSWNKYGEENFSFELINTFNDKEDSIKLEQYYLDNFKAELYNKSMSAFGGGDNLSNHLNREIIVIKIKENTKKWFDGLSDSERKRLYSKYGEDNPMYGKKHTEEARKKMSDKVSKHFETHDSYRKGKTFLELFGEEKALEMKKEISDHASKRIGEKNSFYGKKHTEEAKKKISDNTKGRLPSNTRKVIINGIEYESATKAGKLLGVVTATITHRIKSNNRLYDGYFYKDEM